MILLDSFGNKLNVTGFRIFNTWQRQSGKVSFTYSNSSRKEDLWGIQGPFFGTKISGASTSFEVLQAFFYQI